MVKFKCNKNKNGIRKRKCNVEKKCVADKGVAGENEMYEMIEMIKSYVFVLYETGLKMLYINCTRCSGSKWNSLSLTLSLSFFSLCLVIPVLCS